MCVHECLRRVGTTLVPPKSKIGKAFKYFQNEYENLIGYLNVLFFLVWEMAWLSHLAKKGLAVPNPVFSKNRNLVETVDNPDIGSRNCSVFK